MNLKASEDAASGVQGKEKPTFTCDHDLLLPRLKASQTIITSHVLDKITRYAVKVGSTITIHTRTEPEINVCT